MKEPTNSHRHLPGVGAHDGHIYVIGGTNESWEAQSLVESYNPSTNRQDNMIFLRRRVRVDYCIVLTIYTIIYDINYQFHFHSIDIETNP